MKGEPNRERPTSRGLTPQQAAVTAKEFLASIPWAGTLPDSTTLDARSFLAYVR